jgi:hypothetical protein
MIRQIPWIVCDVVWNGMRVRLFKNRGSFLKGDGSQDTARVFMSLNEYFGRNGTSGQIP